MVHLEKNEGGRKDGLVAKLANNFFGIVTFNMLAGREADALRGRESGVKGLSGWKVGEKDFAVAYFEKRGGHVRNTQSVLIRLWG